MKNLMPLVLMCVMVIMLLVSWSTILKHDDDVLAEYQQHVEMGEKLENKEIYIDAVEEYEAALALRPDNYDLAMKIIDLYEELGIDKSYENACKNAITADSSKAEPYLLLADYYIKTSNNSQAYSILKEGVEKIPENEDFIEKIIELKRTYTQTTIAQSEVGDIYYYDGLDNYYVRVKIDDKYGLINTSASLFLECEYDDIGIMADNLMPVKKNGEYYFVNEDLYRKLVPDVTVEYFGSFGDGYAPAKYNGFYGYVDENLNQCNIGDSESADNTTDDGIITYSFDLDYAGCFLNGVAAVKKGDSWALVDSSLSYITDYEFEDILIDEYGFCSKNNRIFAKKSDGYYLYDCEGNELAGPFEDAKLFVSDQPAAVKQNGKWGFVAQNGELVIEPKYEDANSFSVGYAPYLEGGKWGCIDVDCNVLIDPTFDELWSFSAEGYSISKTEDIYKFVIVPVYE